MSDPIDYRELAELYNRCLENEDPCPHENASVTQDGNAITVHCGHCGLYGVMSVETAKRLGWILDSKGLIADEGEESAPPSWTGGE